MEYQLIFGAFYLAALIIGIFLIFLLISEKPLDRARKVLIALLLVIVLVLFDSFFLSVKLYLLFPHGLFLFVSLWLAFPALLFLYTQYSIGNKTRLKALDTLHFMPVLIDFSINFRFYLLPFEDKIRIGDVAYYAVGEPGLFSIFFFGQSFLYLFCLKKQLYITQKMQVVWLRSLWRIWMTVVVFDALLSILVLTHGYNVSFFKACTVILYSCITYFTAYQLLKKPILFFINNNSPLAKYHSTSATLKQLEQLAQKATLLMETEQCFLNTNLRQQTFAKRLATNSVIFSQMLNTIFQQNFNEWVNQYRVQYAEQLIKKGYLKKYSVDAIAEKSGYASKTTFYRNFKKYFGKTPLELQRELNNAP